MKFIALTAALLAAAPALAAETTTEDMAFSYALVKWSDENCTRAAPPMIRVGLAMAAVQPTESQIVAALDVINKGMAQAPSITAACDRAGVFIGEIAQGVEAALSN